MRNGMKYVRADGNEMIGMGHIMRCMAYAADWWRDEEVLFILADERPAAELAKRGFEYYVLGTQYDRMEDELALLKALADNRNTPDGESEALSGEKGVSPGGSEPLNNEAKTISAAYAANSKGKSMAACCGDEAAVCDKDNAKPEMLVDSYSVTPYYLTVLNSMFRVILLDDTADRILPCDVLINYGIYADELGYEEMYPDTELRLGIAYAPVREEFRGVEPVEIREKLRNILVTTGGGDQCHFEMLFADRLLEMYASKKYSDVSWHFVIGPQSRDAEVLHQKAKDHPGLNIVLYENVDNMAELMKNMDLAIAASGGTPFELCRLGIPTVAFMTAENQRRNLESCSSKTGMVNAGDFASDSRGVLDKVVTSVCRLSDPQLRRQISDRMYRLMSGAQAR
jgi:spore coat polysaccharide biosynthesis predicted glycosyltransferase SpsG